ncbi:Prolyl tripeptidyl peptidase precursor [Lacunisphaera limnophila]|uniref:Acyl-peptide hydrolase n=1 Tax=Lacunisphaera limnophila TaxID=1838286 RepID=A0A1D8ARZ6_9BACT|nr:Prolyl tripeptidyl peptidase precursor [Lacunisphaera limnophila]
MFAGLASAVARPLELEDLFRLKRVSDPQLSPDGRTVAYVVTEVLKAENRTQSDIWVIPAEGGEARLLAGSPKHDRHPRWSPDGQWIAFESNRGGSTQLWIVPASGGEARQLTDLSTEAGQAVWAPTGDQLAFVSEVFPEFSDRPFAEADRLNKEKLAARAASPVKARVITQLLYRHWDSWVDGKRKHLFVLPMKAGAATGEPRNVTPGENDAVPTSATFEEGDEFDFSPDGRELAFAAPHHVTREQAWSTNHDIWTVDLSTGERRKVTTSPAADTHPRYSPDGKYLAYRAQARAGFEADRWQVRLHSRNSGEDWSLTADWDVSVGALDWAADSQSLVFPAQEAGTEPVFEVPVAGGTPRKLHGGGVNGDVSRSADGRQIYFLHSSYTQPPEVWRADLVTRRAPMPVTRTNETLLAELELPAAETVTVPGAGGTPVQMYILKPPGFDAAKKYPLVFWVHGGPQSAFLDSWSTRWNPQLWAAQGYVLAMPNPRGSTGFGQQFTDEISHDWGGKVFEDLMAALAHLEKQPWIDTDRMAAAGASYGGYMMNWFQGHTDKFKTLVTHCGVYEFTSMYGTTEETWFDEWDHGIPWQNPDFEKFSPHRHAAKFRTPNLIIHNELDFRVPLNQGLSLFTTLQRQGVPSKLLYFPDEGHWVLKPANSELWHTTVFDWLAEYLQK